MVLDLQRCLRRGEQPDTDMVTLLHAAAELGQEDATAGEASVSLAALATALAGDKETTQTGLEWLCDRAAAALETLCGIAPADWDLLPPLQQTQHQQLALLPQPHESASGTLLESPTRPQTAALADISLYLQDLRSPFNVGSIIRSAAAFGCRELYLSPGCSNEQHPRCLRAAMGAHHMLEITRISLSELRERQPESTVVALETGGTPISEFVFPRQGVLVLGNEELGIDSSTLAAPDAHRVSIPCYGAKATLNVGVAAGIALSWWRAR
ncbi:MAG: TrmH family RNA methyltransferase [Spirochaetaceae bacterium]|nr:MAG: TrmH family RNA methyltransferase [Spirochaetaceae bacterium]